MPFFYIPFKITINIVLRVILVINMQNVLQSNMNNNKLTCAMAKSNNHFSISYLINNHPQSAYLISTAIANASKAKFYADDLPSLEDVSMIKKV